jgi:hypothetical protein
MPTSIGRTDLPFRLRNVATMLTMSVASRPSRRPMRKVPAKMPCRIVPLAVPGDRADYGEARLT